MFREIRDRSGLLLQLLWLTYTRARLRRPVVSGRWGGPYEWAVFHRPRAILLAGGPFVACSAEALVEAPCCGGLSVPVVQLARTPLVRS